MIVEYILAKECVNERAWHMCHKCGKCGRVFDNCGFMIDDGGTTLEDEYEDD